MSSNDKEICREIIPLVMPKTYSNKMDDKPSRIFPVASDNSFFDCVSTHFVLKELPFIKKIRDGDDSSPPKSRKFKNLFLKSGPDVTHIPDESAKIPTFSTKRGFSVSDSMLQLSGQVYFNYQRLLLQEDSSEGSTDISSTLSSSVSSDSCIYSSAHGSSGFQSSSSSESSLSELSPPEPPDGGWGWIVVIAAFFVQMITDGVQVSFGIFLDDLFEDFNKSLSVTSWVGSFAYGIPALGAPLASILINRFGCRKVCVIGGIISAVGCGLSFFVQSLVGLILTFGVLCGLGSSLSSTAALIIVSVYFDDRRATATGLSIAGTGVGAFVFAPLVFWLISRYTWRGAMLILSGIFANLTVCGVLMRPVETRRERHKRQLLACMENFAKELGFKLPEVYLKLDDSDIDYRIHLLRKLLSNPIDLNCSNSSSLLSISKNIAEGGEIPLELTSLQPNYSHEAIPKDSLTAIPEECIESSPSILNELNLPSRINLDEREPHKCKIVNFKRQSLPEFHKILCSTQKCVSGFGKNINKKFSADTTSLNLLTTSDPQLCTPQVFADFVQEIQLPRIHRKQSHENVHTPTTAKNTPTANTDHQGFSFVSHRAPNLITLRSSLAQLQPLYSRTKRSIYHRSTVFHSSTDKQFRTVLSMPELVSASHASSSTISFGSELLSRIKAAIDLSLFRSLHFNIFLISNLCLYFWCNVTYFFIAIYAIKNNVSSTLAAMLLSIMGASDMVGEVAFGWAADQKWFNTLLLYTSAVLVCGVSTSFVPFATSFTSLVIYSIIFGFTMAANDSLCTVLLIEFVGLSRLVNGLGFCLFCQGIATIFGPPVIGFIMDSSDSHAVAFVVCGVGVTCAALVMIPVIVRERRHVAAKMKRREARKLLTTSSVGSIPLTIAD